MSKRYSNSPIIEAVCELRLAPDSKWDLTIPGLIYETIKNDFPNKEQRRVSNQLILPKEILEKPQNIEQQLIIDDLALFRSEDQKQLIQVGNHLLSINRLKPYISWNQFRPLIGKAFEILRQVAGLNEIQRIGLRYINRIDVPDTNIKLENYFEFKPSLGRNLPEMLIDFIVKCSLSYYDGRDICRIQLRSVIPEDKNSSSFLLDLDYFLNDPKAVTENSILEWADKAHEEIEKVFEGCITDRLRTLFDEVK